MVTPRASKKVLSDLKASILNPALTSHFQCWFYPPSPVRSLLPTGEVQDDRMWSLSCAEAALPGTSLATGEITNDFTGVTERHVYRRQYDTTSSFTFYVDHDYKIINFFEKWIGYIVNEGYINQNPSNDNYFYRVNFPKLYQTSIYIKKFEKDYDRILEYKFLKAYPLSINTMSVSYEASQLLKCTVNFNFSRYLVETRDNDPEYVLPYFPDGAPVMGPLPLNNPPTGITLNV
tara:strand:- start:42 stop:740 length:699 start_codon:yes stop_codon:yes gene_type:complete